MLSLAAPLLADEAGFSGANVRRAPVVGLPDDRPRRESDEVGIEFSELADQFVLLAGAERREPFVVVDDVLDPG